MLKLQIPLYVLFLLLFVTSPTDGAAKSRRHEQRSPAQRPCVICPANSILFVEPFNDNEINEDCDDVHCVRMPQPVARPCLGKKQQRHHQRRRYNKNNDLTATVKTEVIRGPSPGTFLGQGSHRVVLRISYQNNINNNNSGGDDDDEEEEKKATSGRPDAHPVQLHSYCRYTVTVIAEDNKHHDKRSNNNAAGKASLCRPPPSPENSRIVCFTSLDGSSSTDVRTLCHLVCNTGYVVPRSQVHLSGDWMCNSTSVDTVQLPACAKYDAPIPHDHAQCSDVYMTVREMYDDADHQLQFPLPRFRSENRTMPINVTCDINSISAPFSSDDNDNPTITFRRSCVAINSETDARFDCSYNIHLVHERGQLDKKESALMMATMHFHIHQPTTSSLAPSVWCEDSGVAGRLIDAIRTVLTRYVNVDACRKANCTSFTANCHDDDAARPAAGSDGSLMDIEWTVTAEYLAFNADDYFYEGGDVPEGEALIEKIQVDTQNAVENGDILRRELELAGGRLLNGSFRLGLVDLVCPRPGHIIDPSTNQCRKCSANTFQVRGTCEPCPAGTYQDKPGQTECRPKSLKTKQHKSEPITSRPIVIQHQDTSIMIRPFIEPISKKSPIKKNSSLPTAAHTHRPPTLSSRHVLPIKLKKPSEKVPVALAIINGKNRRDHQQYTVVDSDPCRPVNPCLNGGTCLKLNDHLFECSCPPAFTGPRCQQLQRQRLLLPLPAITSHAARPGNSDEAPKKMTERTSPETENKNEPSVGILKLVMGYCASNPCRNGGRCVDHSHTAPAPGFFTCHCPSNFQGDLCDLKPCPKSVARMTCRGWSHTQFNRRRPECLLNTKTGRRQCGIITGKH